MKKAFICTNIILLVVAVLAAWHFYGQSVQLHNLVAVSRGDGTYGDAFYGAYVYAVPVGREISVQAKIYIGRGTPLISYQHTIGELERVAG